MSELRRRLFMSLSGSNPFLGEYEIVDVDTTGLTSNQYFVFTPAYYDGVYVTVTNNKRFCCSNNLQGPYSVSSYGALEVGLSYNKDIHKLVSWSPRDSHNERETHRVQYAEIVSSPQPSVVVNTIVNNRKQSHVTNGANTVNHMNFSCGATYGWSGATYYPRLNYFVWGVSAIPDYIDFTVTHAENWRWDLTNISGCGNNLVVMVMKTTNGNGAVVYYDLYRYNATTGAPYPSVNLLDNPVPRSTTPYYVWCDTDNNIWYFKPSGNYCYESRDNCATFVRNTTGVGVGIWSSTFSNSQVFNNCPPYLYQITSNQNMRRLEVTKDYINKIVIDFPLDSGYTLCNQMQEDDNYYYILAYKYPQAKIIRWNK